MKNADEQREQRLSLLRGVEEEILSFVFNLEIDSDLYIVLGPLGEEFYKICKKISEKTLYSEDKISEIIMPVLIAYIHGTGKKERRKKEARKILKHLIGLFSHLESQADPVFN